LSACTKEYLIAAMC